jgi:hypothetical protein
MTYYFLANMINPMRLLTKIIMTNLWPIKRYIYISLDRARFMHAVKGHCVDLCSFIIHIIHAATQEKQRQHFDEHIPVMK